jgi:hypothetical protein
MAKAKVITTRADIDAAIARAKNEPDEPLVVTAEYIAKWDLFIVALTDDSPLVLPRERSQGLERASEAQLANLQVLALGTSLHWEDLDFDLYVPALVAGIYGTKQRMSRIGRSGGKVKSDTKALAAKNNGLKGGRPSRTELRA